MDGAKIGIFKETHHVGLSCLLKGEDRLALESQVALVLLSDFSDQSLEGELADEELSGLLELSDLAESDCAGSEPVRLLDTSWSRGCRHRRSLPRSLVCKLLPRRLSTSVLPRSLLCPCHLLLCSLNYYTDRRYTHAF